MKLTIFAICMIVAIASAQNKDTIKLDNTNLDEILKSDRLLKSYFNCLMDRGRITSGRCTPDGNELKRILPDALKTGCSTCTEKQKIEVERIIRFLIEKKPKYWEELQNRFDPDNIYFNKYKALFSAR